jgi:hypothetical protein
MSLRPFTTSADLAPGETSYSLLTLRTVAVVRRGSVLDLLDSAERFRCLAAGMTRALRGPGIGCFPAKLRAEMRRERRKCARNAVAYAANAWLALRAGLLC